MVDRNQACGTDHSLVDGAAGCAAVHDSVSAAIRKEAFAASAGAYRGLAKGWTALASAVLPLPSAGLQGGQEADRSAPEDLLQDGARAPEALHVARGRLVAIAAEPSSAQPDEDGTVL